MDRSVMWFLAICLVVFVGMFIHDDVIEPAQRRAREKQSQEAEGRKRIREIVQEEKRQRRAEQDRLFEEARRGVPGAKDAYEESIREDALGDR